MTADNMPPDNELHFTDEQKAHCIAYARAYAEQQNKQLWYKKWKDAEQQTAELQTQVKELLAQRDERIGGLLERAEAAEQQTAPLRRDIDNLGKALAAAEQQTAELRAELSRIKDGLCSECSYQLS